MDLHSETDTYLAQIRQAINEERERESKKYRETKERHPNEREIGCASATRGRKRAE